MVLGCRMAGMAKVRENTVQPVGTGERVTNAAVRKIARVVTNVPQEHSRL